MCVSRTNDPCGFLCIFIMYAAVLYGDYVVLKWILFDVYESLLAIVFHVVLFHALIVFVLRSHCQAALRDPGFCVRRPTGRSRRTRRHCSTNNRKKSDDDDSGAKDMQTNDSDYLNKFDLTSSVSTSSSSSSSSSSSITVVQMDTVSDSDNGAVGNDDHDDCCDSNDRKDWTICMKCELWRPPRAHHCRVCRRCVRRMDHHCPWINNCVGERNQRDFVRFLLAVSLLSCYTIVLVLDTWLNTDSSSSSASTQSDSTSTLTGSTLYLHNLRSLHLNIVFVESVLFGLFGFVMFVDQQSLTASDTTTLEKKRNKAFAANSSTVVSSRWRHWRLQILPCLSMRTRFLTNSAQSPLPPLTPPIINSTSRRKNHKLSYPNYIV